MKAAVCLLLLASATAHVLEKRSLLGGSRHGAGHHGGHHGAGHHEETHRQGGHRGRGRGVARAGRDGAHPHHEEQGRQTASAPVDSYLPAEEDDYEYEEDSLAGYNPGQRSGAGAEGQAAYAGGRQGELGEYEGQAEYTAEGREGQEQYQGEEDQEQYQGSGSGQGEYQDEDEATNVAGATAARSSVEGYAGPNGGRAAEDGYAGPEQDYAGPEEGSADASGRGADEAYGAPGSYKGKSSDSDYAAPREGEEGYAAPREGEEGSAAPQEGEEGYSAPDGEYGAPAERAEDAYGAPAGSSYAGPGNGFPFTSVEAVGRQGEASKGVCPGDSIEACVDVCPGSSARVYGACVGGCANRCPE